MSPDLVVEIVVGATATYAVATLLGALLARFGFPLPPGDKRVGCVDGLRGYLALSVLIHHFIIWIQVTRLNGHWAHPSVHFFDQLGAAGVALFFMTTGLVFYPRVLAGFRACSWPAIFITRLFRIVPLIAFSVFVITLIIINRTGHGLNGNFPLDAMKWIATWSEPPLLGYADSGRLNAYVLWSLWYEWVFYLLVLPACALAMDLIRGLLPSWVLPATLLTGSLAAQALRLPGSLFLYLPLFATGMLAYECQRRERLAKQFRKSLATVIAAAGLTIGMVMFETPFAFALPLFAFFFICVACGNQMGGLLRTRASLVIGECSYGIYILHGVLLSALFVDAAALTQPLSQTAILALMPLAALGAMVLTPVTYMAIERPGIRLGSWLAKRWTGRSLRTDSRSVEVAP